MSKIDLESIEACEIEGKTLKEACEILNQLKFEYRVISNDGVPALATADVRMFRVNMHVINNIVVKYTWG